MNGAAMNTCLQVLLWTCVFISLGLGLELFDIVGSRVVPGQREERGDFSPGPSLFGEMFKLCKARWPSFQVR